MCMQVYKPLLQVSGVRGKGRTRRRRAAGGCAIRHYQEPTQQRTGACSLNQHRAQSMRTAAMSFGLRELMFMCWCVQEVMLRRADTHASSSQTADDDDQDTNRRRRKQAARPKLKRDPTLAPRAPLHRMVCRKFWLHRA